MVAILDTVKIYAPADRVYEYLMTPENLPEIWPSLVEIKEVQRPPQGGYLCNWVYKMGGLRFEGKSEVIEFSPNASVVSKISGGIEAQIGWYLKADGGETWLTFQAEYKIPTGLFGRIAEAIILRFNEREVETILFNLMYRLQDWEDLEKNL